MEKALVGNVCQARYKCLAVGNSGLLGERHERDGRSVLIRYLIERRNSSISDAGP